MVTKIGTAKNDVLGGANKDDFLSGKGGKDVLSGRGGDDKLTGGGGKDTFVFSKHDSGKDVVTDFDLKKDILEIAKGTNGIKTAKDVLDHAKSANGGEDTVINLGGGNKITLKGVKLSDLKHGDPSDHFDIT